MRLSPTLYSLGLAECLFPGASSPGELNTVMRPGLRSTQQFLPPLTCLPRPLSLPLCIQPDLSYWTQPIYSSPREALNTANSTYDPVAVACLFILTPLPSCARVSVRSHARLAADRLRRSTANSKMIEFKGLDPNLIYGHETPPPSFERCDGVEASTSKNELNILRM